MDESNRSHVQEDLSHLYLRLNGYFVSSLIAQSDKYGKIKAQIDALAVRHPFHRQPEREVGPSPFLHPTGTDLLICEVKSFGRQLQFNESLRDHADVIESVLRWAGLFDEEETKRVGRELQPILQPATPAAKSEAGVPGAGGVFVRPLLCQPEQEHRKDNQPWFACGEEMFSYIAKCVNPEMERKNCSTHYDTTAWGWRLTPIVNYFKQRPVGDAGKMSDLYDFLKAYDPASHSS